jgi:regulator of sirC expression with transglutaminase-like and TPR domain
LPLAIELAALLAEARVDLARAALVIAKLESPALDPSPCLDALDALGERARARLANVAGASVRARITALNGLLFEDERFAGNRAHYDDVRNSFLNVVLERRLGIPITLALVYMEVARRAGVEVQGVAFPGHFLMRVPKDETGGTHAAAVILDPFGGGVELNRADCLRLLGRHMGPLDDNAALDPRLLAPCTTRQMLARMLNNLKRAYIDSRSFPQARAVSDLLLAVDPAQTSELRDRGLLAYHLDDFPGALRDLEHYLRVNAWRGESDREEREQIREHVQTLRNRVASLN